MGSASVVEEKLEEKEETQKSNLGLEEEDEAEGLGANGVSLKGEASSSFKDPRWVKGNWDLKQFEKNGSTDWDAVIDAGLISSIKIVFFLILKFSVLLCDEDANTFGFSPG